ncbi:4031_t:CDS:2 [Racocetra fulgida]|uniref:4031_t:CDS:1 n=1 Tax=Racocetra fulgida TaxID=60492 RepID=A0A9N9FFB8_9GLOM|nr:4031_t:CDS:2 [Racocetra fulgida]
MEGYVQINGSFASDLSQDLENLANTIASSYAGDPVILRSSQNFNGRNGDVIQARKKYDVVVPHNFFDLNHVLTMLSYRWGTEYEHFWLVMLKCIGLTTKQNAIKTIVELLPMIDYSSIPLDDEKIVSRINISRELITTLELKWKDAIR